MILGIWSAVSLFQYMSYIFFTAFNVRINPSLYLTLIARLLNYCYLTLTCCLMLQLFYNLPNHHRAPIRRQRTRTLLDKIVKEKPFDNHIRAIQVAPRGGLIIFATLALRSANRTFVDCWNFCFSNLLKVFFP